LQLASLTSPQAAGVAEDKVELKKPEHTKVDGPAAEVRRVEVNVQ
jgi:hypothetical protein